ncbi:hypothetical protein U27_04640 [Candidatus Vecturithrix granuli]|uniref:Uncharacterized protein n=1 Tax=Vecturithrix granuli TaxID=1499967 RepID=A0A081BZB8_VECG1|nr:hypothetical protein U27_04640 [Candidatus Vecturithrix granuli]
MKIRRFMFVTISALLLMMLFSCATETSKKPVKRGSQAKKSSMYKHLATLQEADCSGVRPGTTGSLVADSGFRPHPHGFSFPNYSKEFPEGNLKVEDARMLFGDQICKSIKDGKCLPTTAAHLWIKNMNAAMEDGHCEGMAVLSSLFFREQSQIQEYGQTTTFKLTPEKTSLLRSIAAYWTLQSLEPVISESLYYQTKTPAEILRTLIEALKTGQEFYTLGIYGSFGGHSITPYAVEDIGKGIFWIHVYDNNYPCTYKYVEIDTNLNTWRYAAGVINLDEEPMPWEGSTGSIDLTSLSIRQQPVECPFCQDAQTGCGSGGRLAVLMNSKDSTINATNQSGQQVGIDEMGRIVNQIPGAKLLQFKGPEMSNVDKRGLSPSVLRSTLIMLPPDPQYTFNLTGHATLQQSETAQIGVFQPCQAFTIDQIALKPGQQNQLIIANGNHFRYTPGDKDSPQFRFATYAPRAVDGLYTVQDITLNEGAIFDIKIDLETNKINISDDDPELDSFDLDVTIVDEDGNIEKMSYDDIEAGDEGQAIFDVDEEGNWDLEIDADSDGLIDDEDFDDDNDGVVDDDDIDDDGDGISDDEDLEEDYDDEEFDNEEFDDDEGYDDDEYDSNDDDGDGDDDGDNGESNDDEGDDGDSGDDKSDGDDEGSDDESDDDESDDDDGSDDDGGDDESDSDDGGDDESDSDDGGDDESDSDDGGDDGNDDDGGDDESDSDNGSDDDDDGDDE